MDPSFLSAIVILLLVMDPIGNIPLFVSLLRNVAPARRTQVILRECAIAFGVLLVFVFLGPLILQVLGLSDSSLTIAGGVILFLIALRMIFRHPDGLFGDAGQGEPFIVPLAIPSIAGPAAIATVVLLVSREPQRWIEWSAAVTVAMLVSVVILLLAERIARRMTSLVDGLGKPLRLRHPPRLSIGIASTDKRMFRHYAEAVEAYQNAIRGGPQTGATWLGFGISLEGLGRKAEAAQAYRRALGAGQLTAEAREYAETRSRALE